MFISLSNFHLVLAGRPLHNFVHPAMVASQADCTINSDTTRLLRLCAHRLLTSLLCTDLVARQHSPISESQSRASRRALAAVGVASTCRDLGLVRPPHVMPSSKTLRLTARLDFIRASSRSLLHAPPHPPTPSCDPELLSPLFRLSPWLIRPTAYAPPQATLLYSDRRSRI